MSEIAPRLDIVGSEGSADAGEAEPTLMWSPHSTQVVVTVGINPFRPDWKTL